jgi:AraC-like DNA-binding protein
MENAAEERTPAGLRETLFTDILRGTRLRGSVYFRPELGAPWGVSIADHGTIFHIIAAGRCWLRAKSLAKPVALESGDFVVATRGEPHTLHDQPASPVINFFDLVKRHASGANGGFRAGGEGPTTKFVCGGMQFENGANNPLLAVLPPFLHVRGSKSGGLKWLRLTVEHILAELDSDAVGASEVVTRLADILFIQAVRAHFHENADTAQSGWLAAARDKQIGRALALLHARPDEPWTIDLLARQLATSRTAFADRFSELVGEPPLRYLTRLRINAATRRLRSSDDKLSAIAADAGYESVSAFNRAFKRQVGMTPGEYRDSKEYLDWRKLGCDWDAPVP